MRNDLAKLQQVSKDMADEAADLFIDTVFGRTQAYGHYEVERREGKMPTDTSKWTSQRDRLEECVTIARRVIATQMAQYKGTTFTDEERIEAAARNVVTALQFQFDPRDLVSK